MRAKRQRADNSIRLGVAVRLSLLPKVTYESDTIVTDLTRRAVLYLVCYQECPVVLRLCVICPARSMINMVLHWCRIIIAITDL